MLGTTPVVDEDQYLDAHFFHANYRDDLGVSCATPVRNFIPNFIHRK
jgi:hypothetical protein